MFRETLQRIPAELRWTIAILALLAALVLHVRSIRHLRASERLRGTPEQPRELIRGFRVGMLAIGLDCAAVGLLTTNGTWIVFAGVFLLEEMFETGVMLLAGRGRKR